MASQSPSAGICSEGAVAARVSKGRGADSMKESHGVLASHGTSPTAGGRHGHCDAITVCFRGTCDEWLSRLGGSELS